MKRRVFIGIGSNLGDRTANLRHAVDAFPDVVAVSSLYETEPIGPPGQDPHYNAVIELLTDIDAHDLLHIALGSEQHLGRIRAEKNGPRILDVDVLWIDGETIDEPDLQVPHPRMWERRFVLAPLHELAPDLVPDDWETSTVGWVRSLGSL
jgi:2-amino-4-hydroxy-6-hydroxymethyldihydropteridine diphosphokinase